MNATKKYVYVITCLAVAVISCGGLSYAQNYKWANIGSIGVNWNYNESGALRGTSNTNSGAVVLGGRNPSGSLKLDVVGGVGGTQYCSEDGASCLQVSGARAWKYNVIRNDLYVEDTTTQVGIGTTNPTQRLHVGGNMLADVFLYESDKNLKTNIEPLSGMDIISKLSGVRFDWIDTGISEVGVIAQEVEAVLPELVVTDENTGLKMVQYSNLVAPLIQAVNEQRKQLEDIERDIQMVKSMR